MKKFLKYWLPVFAYMALIFYISSIPKLKRIGFKGIYISNYSLHIAEYAILAFLFYRAFIFSADIKLKKNAILLAILFSVLYGITDEYHQLFVPGRIFSGYDILANAAGSFLISFKKILKR